MCSSDPSRRRHTRFRHVTGETCALPILLLPPLLLLQFHLSKEKIVVVDIADIVGVGAVDYAVLDDRGDLVGLDGDDVHDDLVGLGGDDVHDDLGALGGDVHDDLGAFDKEQLADECGGVHGDVLVVGDDHDGRVDLDGGDVHDGRVDLGGGDVHDGRVDLGDDGVHDGHVDLDGGDVHDDREQLADTHLFLQLQHLFLVPEILSALLQRKKEM